MIPTARLEEIREGCEGVQGGPWFTDGVYVMSEDATGGMTLADCAPARHLNIGHAKQRANHIANCDPQTISAIVSELIERRNKDAEHAK